MKSKRMNLLFALLLIATGVHAKARKPNLPDTHVIEKAQPIVDYMFVCQYCKRPFKVNEGRITRWHVRDEDHWICIECLYDALDAAMHLKQKAK